jgi:hypothetical protein
VAYNAAQLVATISLDDESGYKGRGDLEITFWRRRSEEG